MPLLLMDKHRSVGSLAETYYRILMDRAAAEMDETEYAKFIETYRQLSEMN